MSDSYTLDAVEYLKRKGFSATGGFDMDINIDSCKVSDRVMW